MIKNPLIRIALLFLLLGLIPALVLSFAFDFSQEGLHFGGVLLAPGFDVAQLFASALSAVGPMIRILPIALVFLAPPQRWPFWLVVCLAPILLLGPLLLVCGLSGGADWPSAFGVFALLALFLVDFCLWLLLGIRFLGAVPALVIWGALSTISDLLVYVTVNLLPYMDVPGASFFRLLLHLVPQPTLAMNLADEILLGGQVAFGPIFACLGQIVVLAAVLAWFAARDMRQAQQARS